ncbi:hypothetical protein NUW58_g7073 [Xylaria curta]|uniref:Uncharacterized protein n=1 Tax=Xylaria curta TaxID=42375 RepID=A0ACC1NN48_9PEZI|nr:hypothetical protein NUW58_g7073 [Xylaria curta]
MGHQSAGVSCLSAEPHEDNISNHLLHFFGCIEICERDGFLNSIDRQSTLTRCEETNQAVKNPKANWKANIEAEKQRIVRLRYALLSDDDDKKLVDEVDDSRVQWQQSPKYRENIERVKAWRLGCGKKNTVFEREPVHGPSEPYKVEADISVPIIQFKNGQAFEDKKDSRLDGRFPNQKTTIEKLFEPSPEGSLLYNEPESDRSHIKYIHIPSNNMQWAEEAIAQYYGESRPDFTRTRRRPQRPQTNAQIILQDRYWRGLFHRDASLAPHARYMSHTCQTILLPMNGTSQERENIVLFMPYLHWETSTRQVLFAKEINKFAVRTATYPILREDEAKRRRQNDRRELTKCQFWHPRAAIPQRPIKDVSGVVEEVMGYGLDKFESYNPLGRYILAAARLYEDQQPLLVRAFHRYDEENNKWPEHEELRTDDCGTCRANIKKVSRVVMVDQLWMWILDAKTLITCFPKRYGAKGRDTSAVHKSIRTNLENLGSDQMQTVFELALIVLEKCTMTFFDRTKTLDKQPHVVDGVLQSDQGSSREAFRSPSYRSSKLHLPLLDIYREWKLKQVLEESIKELDMMIPIFITHRDIIKRFVEQTEEILDPDRGFRTEFSRHSPRRDQQSDFDETKEFDGQSSRAKKREDYLSFKLRANGCQDRVDSHVRDLEALRNSAKKTADEVLNLLSLKQQQASVVQAWQAVKQSDETIKQGRSIVVFTLATIVFLPLSFLTSLFGMNNYEFGDNNWKLKDQLLYIFSISAGVVLICLLFAFSAWLRVWAWSLGSRVLMELLTKSGIYEYIPQLKPIERIADETHVNIERKKMDLKRRILKKKSQKAREAKAEEEKRVFRDKMMKMRKSQTENIQGGSTLDSRFSIFDEIHGVKKSSWGPSDLIRNPVLAMSTFWEWLGLARLSSRPKKRGNKPSQSYNGGGSGTPTISNV